MAARTWGNSNNFWNVASAWVQNAVPTSIDDALILNGNVTNNSAANANSVEIDNAATLTTTANMTVVTAIRIGGGSGTATFSVNGGTTIADTVIIGNQIANGAAVNVSGNGTLSATTISIGSAAIGTLTVFAGGVVNATSGIALGNGGFAASVIVGGSAAAAAAGTVNANIAFNSAGSSLLFRTTDTATYTGNLSGAGSVTVNSAGQSAILTGTNTHSGATTITAGTLQIGNGGTTGTLGSGAVNIAAGATLAFQHGAGQYGIANVIGGSGNVVQRGAPGSLEILTANNNYTGTTTISAGTLQIGNGGTTGSLGSGAVSIGVGGTLDFNRSGGSFYFVNNAISGAGDVVFRGGAPLVLAGNNSYTGTTTVGTGTTVQVNSNIGTGNVLNSGFIDFNNGGATTYAGIISGTGNVRVGGALTLTGANTYSGSTNIAASTLQIGNGGTGGSLGSGAVTIASGATLAFQHGAGQYVNANVISGAGNVVQRGAGALEILTGNNSYTGTTTIDGSTLAVGFGGTTGTLGSGNVILANSGNLDLIRSDTQVIANNITGAGNVRIYANHTAILTGANTYSGTSEIFAGANTLQIGDSGTTGSLGSSAVSIGAGATLAFQHSSGVYVNANVISGAGNVVHRGGNNVFEALTGNNSYTGTTTIDGGVLQIGVFGGTSGTLGSGEVIFANGGNLDLLRSDTQLIANNLSGGGAVRVYGNHTGILTGTNTSSGTTVIDTPSTLQIGNGGTTGSLGSGSVENNGTLAFQHSAGTYTNANVISGAGSVVQRGTGSTEVLTGNNSYVGSTTINSGTTLQIGNGGASGTLGSGSVTNNGTLAFNRATDSVVAGVISGTGALVKDGGGDIYLTAANTYSGTTTINAGRINIGGIGGNGTTGSLGTGAVILAGANAELNYFRSNDATIANAISGIGDFNKVGIGILTLIGAATHSGDTLVSNGTLRGGGTNVFSASSLVTVLSAGKLDLGGFNQTIGGLSGSGIVENGGASAATLTLNNSAANTFSGVIQDSAIGFLNLTKGGVGTQTLAGINSYTGTTNINSGTLSLSGAGSIANSDVVFLNSATSRFDVSNISGPSASIIDLLSQSGTDGAQVILGGKTLNVTATFSNAGRVSFVGSAGIDAVVFNLRVGTNDGYTLAGLAEATFTNWTDGSDSITINGNTGANILTGDELRATIINGGDGADTIMGGAGNDTLNGGAGIDTISYANSTFGVTVHLDNPTPQNTVQQGLDTISGFENILGSATHDSLFGDNFDNVINGGDGFDTIVSGGGTNTLIGGAGGDTYFVQGVNDIVTEAVGGGFDIVLSQVNFTLAAGSEVEALAVNTTAGISLTGNELQQTLTGNVGSDTLSGGGGNDLIISGGGTNTLIGGTGADIYFAQGVNDVVTEDAGGGFDVVLAGGNLTLAAGSEVEVIAVNTTSGVTITGSNTNQTIQGAGGNDRFVGGLGNDTLTGSGGADTFVLLNSFADRDFVTDFVSGSDKLEISASLFGGGLSAGVLSGAQFLSGVGAASATTAAQRFIYNSSTGNLLFDADGNGAGAAVLFANLSSVPTLTAADFLIAA
jgi:fibronectin-binding autotransporter adhesin